MRHDAAEQVVLASDPEIGRLMGEQCIARDEIYQASVASRVIVLSRKVISFEGRELFANLGPGHPFMAVPIAVLLRRIRDHNAL